MKNNIFIFVPENDQYTLTKIQIHELNSMISEHFYVPTKYIIYVSIPHYLHLRTFVAYLHKFCIFAS